MQLRVLTITTTFPSLIQPWLVNQLVQISENGGENRILARQSEEKRYTSKVDEYGLHKNCLLIPDEFRSLVKQSFYVLLSRAGVVGSFIGMMRFPRVLLNNQLTLREKLRAILFIPYLGLRGIDVIHSHSEMAGNRFLPIVVALRKPLVVTFHGLPPKGVQPISVDERKRYIGIASVVLVNTEFAKRQYVGIGGDETKIKIIPQGIDLDEFEYRPKAFPENGLIEILTVGRFHPDKGQEYAIRAISILIKRGHRVLYRLVGNGPDLSRLMELTKALGIDERVEFYSGLSDGELKSLYARSHMFVLPSLRDEDGLHEETQGVVIQEAQASGLITIATQVGGIPECVDNNVSAFLVEDRSPDALARKLEELIGRAEEWHSIQEQGRRWVEARYSVKALGLRTNALYKSLARRIVEPPL